MKKRTTITIGRFKTDNHSDLIMLRLHIFFVYINGINIKGY
ncbi:hypothetical protein HMPREF0541_01085 [Lacticaseibacillus rhamnosus ATCC 21052]|nr:hypothetical protein HMPREF0541_01085 [Lacticaseibacillus rhamnosus ATCC 21052]